MTRNKRKSRAKKPNVVKFAKTADEEDGVMSIEEAGSRISNLKQVVAYEPRMKELLESDDAIVSEGMRFAPMFEKEGKTDAFSSGKIILEPGAVKDIELNTAGHGAIVVYKCEAKHLKLTLCNVKPVVRRDYFLSTWDQADIPSGMEFGLENLSSSVPAEINFMLSNAKY